MNIEEILETIEKLPLGEVVLESTWSYSTSIPKWTGLHSENLQALAKAFRTLHDCALKYANEDAWTGQFSKDGRQDLWLYGEGKATAVQALKSLGDIVN